MQLNLQDKIILKTVRRNVNFYLQIALFLVLVIFLFISYLYREQTEGIYIAPSWVPLLLILLVVFWGYYFRKYDEIGEIRLNLHNILLSSENSSIEIALSELDQLTFKYNSYAGEVLQFRIFLYGDKHSDGSNNFLIIRSGSKIWKLRVLINSDEEAGLIVSYLTKIRREHGINAVTNFRKLLNY